MNQVSCRLVLAFSSSSGKGGEPLLEALEPYWTAAGHRASYVRLDPALAEQALVTALVAALPARGQRPLVLGGFSLGARIAALAAENAPASALVCFGYPFHARGQPRDLRGLRALQGVAQPCFLAQGERDAHGTRGEVRGYDLAARVQLCWLPDANHRFQPRGAAAPTEADNVRRAAAAALAFLDRALVSSADDGPE